MESIERKRHAAIRINLNECYTYFGMQSLNKSIFIKFILVGILNTLFGYSAFALLIYLKLHYVFAVLFATILGILFNFKTTGRFVFKNKDNRVIFRFIGVYAATYLLNIGALSIFDMVKFNMYIAGLLLLIPMALISFIFQSKYVFYKEFRRCH